MRATIILLATHNGERWLLDQLESIRVQISVDVKLLASDDNSKDATLQILKDKNPSCNFLPSIKIGSAAQNFFRLLRDVDLTSIRYAALSDQDDLWDSDKLSSAISMIEKLKVDAYSSNVTAFWANGKTKLINKAQNQCQFDYMFESAGPGCTFVLTQKLALHLQQFLIQNQQACTDVALHDWFIYAFARTNGYKWVIDKQPHMQYRQHENNVMGANAGWQAKLTRWKKLRAGWLQTQAILLADIIGYSDSWVIKRLKRNNLIDKIVLIINVSKFRRKFIDRLALALSFLVGIKK